MDPEEKQPLLPDGIGLSVEAVRQLLLQKHDSNVPKDDPALMFVTIMQAFLEEEHKLQEKHKEALARFMGEQTALYVTRVEESTADLTKSISGLTVDGIRGAVAGFADSIGSHRSAMYLCTVIMALSALLNVGVFILR